MVLTNFCPILLDTNQLFCSEDIEQHTQWLTVFLKLVLRRWHLPLKGWTNLKVRLKTSHQKIKLCDFVTF